MSLFSGKGDKSEKEELDKRRAEAEKVLLSSRIDISRIQIIGLTRLMDRLLNDRYREVYQRR